MAPGKIALFGGAFDPVHEGHIRLARAFAERLSWDLVILMPSAVPPHKIRENMASAAHRLEMCRLAVRGDSLFSVSDYEISRGGVSFTADTLEWLREQYPDAALFLLTGADMFLTLASWYRFDKIAETAVLCAAPRGEYSTARLSKYAGTLCEKGARCAVEDIPVTDVSSTQIRQYLAGGADISGLVPQQVAAYISENGIYQNGAGYAITRDEQLIEILRGRLSPRRFTHSLAVAEQARFLAPLYGADAEKAYTAGLLHDIMKDQKRSALLQMLDDFGIILDAASKASHKCWHAIAGAAFLERILGIDDRDILNAVRYHTTARAGMSPLEKTLYLADYTSADRDFPDVDTIRALAQTDCAAAMEYALAYTIADLVQRRRIIHPDSISAYNEHLTRRAL